ncbi:hypothetical protein HPP92_026517 [Vanilla planifolia]|uniref:DUF676 domain-containing protein n=1 Tax=Vanilla planifolia TaxID=51239 RepID=A0A835U7G1_VANPL|nr:hypothetical protein HPP92_026517 [Vanilla planifolia]
MVRAMEAAGEGNNSGRERKRRRRVRTGSYIRRMSCFRPSGSFRNHTAAGIGEELGRIPTHLVVTVNGIIGSPDNWRFAAKQLVKRYPEDILIHCSECNYGTLTFDGVDVMGDRLAKEVKSVVERNQGLLKISFLCHSLGGLIARYAIGRLYESSLLKDCSDDIQQSRDCSEHEPKGMIAGLEPVNFITFATPHLGSRFHKQIPIFRGSQALEKMAYRISGIVGRTGKHLFLKDHDEGKPPLLLRMLSDNEDLKFMSALQSFKRRVAYANVCYDVVVGWKTSSIRRQHELPKKQDFVRNENYPHVVLVEKPRINDVKQGQFLEAIVHAPKSVAEMEELMVDGLNRVTWERVDISFRNSKQRIFAHTAIQVFTMLIFP